MLSLAAPSGVMAARIIAVDRSRNPLRNAHLHFQVELLEHLRRLGGFIAW
jgi:hypothetical protein